MTDPNKPADPAAPGSVSDAPKGEILVFGATGQQGGALVQALRARDWPVRAFVRDRHSLAATALAASGVDLAEGNLADPASIRRAMTGVYGVFSVQPNSGQGKEPELKDADEVRYGVTIADLAVELRVGHLVYSSTLLLSHGPTGVPNLDCKLEVEAHLKTLPLRTTIVRPGTFMELLAHPAMGLGEGELHFFVAAHDRALLIAVRDIGRIVDQVFQEPDRFADQTIDIAGDAPTGQAIAEALSHATGRPISYRQIPAGDDAVQKRRIAAFDPANAAAVDFETLDRTLGPSLTFEAWLAGDGRALVQAAVNQGGALSDIHRPLLKSDFSLPDPLS